MTSCTASDTISRESQNGFKMQDRTATTEDLERAATTLPAIIKVAIIEDRRELREGLTILINGTPGYQCVGSFRSMEEALAKIGRDVPHVALVDIGLPGMSGIEGIRILRERFPTISLLVLSVYDDDNRVFEALCAGACGYLLKHT